MRNICLIANKRAVVMQNSTTGLLLLFAILHIKTVFFPPCISIKKKKKLTREYTTGHLSKHTHTQKKTQNKQKQNHKTKKRKRKKNPTHSQ